VDLSSLTKLTKIGNKFMNKCESLETIIFNPEPIITFIGSEFMDYCEELKTIDLRFLKNIEVISYGFLHDCSNLENVIFPDKFGKVKKIGSNFMSETGLQNINLSCFSNVEDIRDNFLEQCVELESVDLSSLTKLYTIGDAFLSGCERLNEIKFSDDANITSVGEFFLSWTNSLTQVDLKCFSQIKMIPRYFLVESGLTCANLSSFTKLTLIGIEFMVQCKNLKTVIMPENFRTKILIGVDFLNNSPVINLWEGDRKCPNVLVSESSASKSPAIESPASRNHTDSGSRNARSNCTNNKCTIMGGKKRTQKNKKKLKKSTRKHKIFYRQ
jgi:hypothetical protein